MANPPRQAGEGPEADPAVPNPTYIGTDKAAERARNRAGDGGVGDGGAGDDTGPPAELRIRVSHLEQRLGGVEGKLDTLIHQLGGIATRTEMRNYLLLAVGLFVAVAAMFIGGMGWLGTRATREIPSQSVPQPIIIQVPFSSGAQSNQQRTH